MKDCVTKEDLKIFRRELLSDIEKIIKINLAEKPPTQNIEWLRSKSIREIMNISAGTLQNLRISGKIRSRKVMGSYYYNKSDLLNLFKDNNQHDS